MLRGTDSRALAGNILDDDLHFPALVLKETALNHNLHAMARWCAANDLLLAPHGKTTMCPKIFERQLQAGAWGITVATVSQAMTAARFGVKRILIANQVIGRANIRSLAALLDSDPHLDCYVLVDSPAAVSHLGAELARQHLHRPLFALIEWGRPGWRTGVRSVAEAKSTRDELKRHSGLLAFAGVEAFEGLAHSDIGPAEDAHIVREFVSGLADLGSTLQHDDSPLLFSVGGSAFLDVVCDAVHALPASFQPVLRSGCYVTHDHGMYQERARQAAARGSHSAPPEFQPALELWSYVQSLPDPYRAILTFGKRDCSYDAGLPVPLLAHQGATITELNDQHAYLSYPEGMPLAVGDKVCSGISHPCTAFDKWRAIPVVDDAYNVIDVYETFF